MTNDEQPSVLDESAQATIDEFNLELTKTRRNAELVKLLDERGRQTGTLPLDEVKRRLGLENRYDECNPAQ